MEQARIVAYLPSISMKEAVDLLFPYGIEYKGKPGYLNRNFINPLPEFEICNIILYYNYIICNCNIDRRHYIIYYIICNIYFDYYNYNYNYM
jgi:hypothetical protein